MSEKTAFEHTPEGQAVVAAYRSDLLRVIETLSGEIGRIDGDEAFQRLHELQHELIDRLRDMSYKFFVEDFHRARIRYERKQRGE